MTPQTYVSEQLSLVIGEPVHLTAEQIARCWTALSREEEHTAPRDLHGNVMLADDRHGAWEDPPLHAEILDLQRRHPHAPPRWPADYRFAACLTHDVDRIVQLPWRERWRQLSICYDWVPLRQAARWAAAAGVYAVGTALGRSDLAPFDAWVQEEARRGVHSTFLVLPQRLQAPTIYDHYYRYNDAVCWQGSRVPFAEAARRVRQAGWEIGLHGSYTAAYDQRLLCAEKAQLEAMLEAPVISTRQHFMRFAVETTPKMQAAAGIQVDSTLGFNATIGCRAGLAFPFFWSEEETVLEVPLIIQDVGLLRGVGRARELEQAIERACRLIGRIAEVGGVVTLSWHTHPEAPGAVDAYRALLAEISRLRGWGCSLQELNVWWRARRDAYRQRMGNACK